jgi:hypothetical protein
MQNYGIFYNFVVILFMETKRSYIYGMLHNKIQMLEVIGLITSSLEEIGLTTSSPIPTDQSTEPPSPIPTDQPIGVPGQPTGAPTPFAVSFAAVQTIDDVSYQDYIDSKAECDSIIKQSIADMMFQISVDYITKFQVGSSSRITARTKSISNFRTEEDSITVAYEIQTFDTSVTYEELSKELNENVDNGNFDTKMHMYSEAANVPVLLNSTSTSVATIDITPTFAPSTAPNSSNNSKLSSGAIAGIVIASILVFGMTTSIVIFYLNSSKNDRSMDIERGVSESGGKIESDATYGRRITASVELLGLAGPTQSLSGATISMDQAERTRDGDVVNPIVDGNDRGVSEAGDKIASDATCGRGLTASVELL